MRLNPESADVRLPEESRPLPSDNAVAWRKYAESLEGVIREGIERIERRLVALTNHVDETDAQLLAEINRLDDKIGETAERVTLKVLADEKAAPAAPVVDARARAYWLDHFRPDA
jgi:hypothetical protein